MKNLKFTIFCFVFLFVTNSLKSQNITATIGSFNSTNCAVGDTLVLPVSTVMGSGISVSAISLAIDYDTTKLQCISTVTDLNSDISAGFLSNCGIFSNQAPNAPYNATTRRQFRAAWFAFTPVTVNGTMFNLRFRVLATGNSSVNWDVATPGNCEFADEFADVIPNVSWVHSSIVCGCSPSSITAAGPTTFCQGGSVVLNAISGTGLTYQWQNNGSNISGATNASYTATMAGSYTVVVFNAPTCSTVSAATTISVTPNNTITLGSAFGTNAQTLIHGTAITNIIYATTGATGATFSGLPAGVSGTWASNTAIISGTPTVAGTFNYMVTMTGGCAGASNTASGTITVNAPAGPNIATSIGAVSGCIGDTVTVPVTINMASGISTSAISMAIGFDPTKLQCISSVTSLNSNISAGFLSNCGVFSGTSQFRAAWFNLTPVAFNGLMFNVRFKILAAGTHNLEWDLATPGNCEYADELGDLILYTTWNNGTVSLAPGCCAPPIATITAEDPTAICQDSSVVLSANIGTGLAYQWALNGTSISGATNSYYTATSAGSYTVVVFNALTCSTVSTPTIVTISNNNTIALGSAPGTNAQTLYLGSAIANITYATTGATGATFSGLPAGVSGTWASNTATISGTPTAVGAFNYTVTMTGGCNGGNNTVSGTINVNLPVGLNIATSIGVVSGCIGDTISVPVTINMASGISTAAISMAIGYDPTKLQCISSVTSLNPNISAGFLSNCGVFSGASQFRAAWFNLSPVAFNGLMFNMRFVVLSTGSHNLEWDLATPGNCEYADELADVIPNTTWSNGSVAFDSGCPTPCTPPIATITPSGPNIFCQGGSVVLNANSGNGLTYQWRNNNINLTGATNAWYTATTSGVYSVVVTDELNCSAVSSGISITVNTPPIAGNLAGVQSICVAGTAAFSSTVSGGTWSSSDSTIAIVNASTGLVMGVSAGTATITYTVTGTGGCANVSANRTVTVTAAPSPGTLSGSQAICVAGTTTFTSTVSGGSWSSSASRVASINVSTGLVTGVSAGTATMTYTVIGTGGCANATATRTVTVTAAPSAGTLSGNQVVCIAGTTTFTSTASSGTWSSSNTAVATVNSSTGLITGVGAGTANITYSVEGTGGCMDATASLSIQVVEPPFLTNQPLPQSVPVGQNAVFTIGHNSTNSTLQWQTDLGWGFQDLTNAGQYSGVNSPTLTVSNSAFQNNNQLFRCILFDGICSGDTSNIVSLSVVARQNTANVPARFNFQSVIRDTTGALVTNRSLGVRITLNRGPQMGILYSETHQLTSNSNGLITTSIGGGTPVVGSMDSIDWSLGDVYIKTEVDVNGGSNYEMLSSNQLLSVPYALFAHNSGSGTPGPAGPQGPMGPAGPQGIQGPAGPAGGGGNGTLAMVRTVGVTEVMYTLARVEASLDASGGEFVVSKGFCLDTLPVPTVDKGIAVAGGGLGSFELGLSGLEAGRSYYVRAYATTAAGTAYGHVLSFQTRALAVPAPTTEAASGVGAFGAQLRGSLADTASGGMALTARGFRWSSTAGFASASGQDLPAQATAGQGFSAQLQGLTTSTTYYFRAYASNALGTGYGAEVSFTTGTQPLSHVQTQAPLGVSQTQALVEGIVTDDAGAVVTARGFCYSTNNNPLIGNDTVLAGAGLGTFTATLRNLITDTTYFYRAFAINAGGVGYGLVQSFQTSSGSGSITTPLVTTTPVIRTDSNHVMGGVITWDGNSSISSQGICWNRIGMPTLSDSVILFTPQGLGSFTLAVQLPLGCHEPFYVRAFAQNAVGVSYGNEFLTTNGYQPRLIGTQMAQIGGLTANLQSNVVTTGGCPILERGVCWGTSPNPTNSNSFYGRTICSPDTGVMNCQLNHLFPQTLYYARAYMVNATGTYYGDEVTFTTDTTSELYIGKLHAGGLIFYLDSTRQHGMVCITNDLGDYQWGCHGTDIPNTSTSFGAGFTNTSLITLNCAQRPIAASVCADLVLNGYSDWFLPSIGELQLMYSRLHLQGLGGFGGFWYWSSSQEQNPHLAWTMGFDNGGFNHNGFSGKNYYSRVRAVRAF